ncbi:MAG: glycosyltransferase family 2 protein [Chloroflexota bacterium]|nr:glycosyltransferase family 2 protein [Chloroflexota bacterium]
MIQEVVPKLAVIIINHQQGDMLKRAVESLKNSSYDKPYQVFIINNLKDDATKKWLTQTFPDIELIENDKPKGFGSNNNQIIAGHADFDYYLLFNPDATCLSGMLSELISVMEDNPQIGAAGPRLLNPDGSIQPSRRRFASFLVLLVRALHIDALFKDLPVVDHYLMNDIEFNDIAEVDWITGAVMILRKKALESVGLFDERFHLYFEDEDLCCRMWQQGWKVCYLNTAEAYHMHIAEGRKKLFSKANFHHVGSAFKMLLKYHGKIVRCYDKGAVNRDSLSNGM